MKGGDAIQNGSLVKMNYTLTVDGAVVDTSTGKEPLSYVQGSGQMIPGLEKRMEGLRSGDKREFSVTPKDGYGEFDKNAVMKVPKDAFPESKGIKPGDVVQGMHGNRPVRAKVVELGGKEITLDFNHPLAGKTLNFAIEVLEVSKPGPQAAPKAP